MQLCDFFIECAQTEMKIEMSRQFLTSLPTYHPYSAFLEISNNNLFITAKSLSIFFIIQGIQNNETECQLLTYKPMKYESFLKLILPIDIDVSIQGSKLPLNEEARLQLSRHLNLHLSLLRILQPPQIHFSGTIEQIAEYFKNNLQFISLKELNLIKRLLDYEDSGIIDTRIPFQISFQLDTIRSSELVPNLKQKKQQIVQKPISDMKDKDLDILPVDSPLIVILSILKKELKLSSIRKKLYNIQNFNIHLAFQQIDKELKGFITMKDYDDYLNQPHGTAKYLFHNINQIDMNYFKDLFKPQLINELPQPKSLKTNINFKSRLQEYLRILQIAPSKINKPQNYDFEQITSQIQIEQYLRQNGYNYTTEEINLLFQKQYISGSNIKNLILQNTTSQ